MEGNMNQKVALRYAVIQFMPYIETGEFANIGIVALSPKTGFFDYKIAKKYRRITQFFPNLHGREYRAGVSFFEQELKHLKDLFFHRRVEEAVAREIFDHLTREKETIVRTSKVGVRMVNDETEGLNQLFDYYVSYSFVSEKNNESLLTQRITNMVKEFNLTRPFLAEKIGDDEFNANFPLVQRDEEKRLNKIIKPIYLGQNEPSKIYEKSDGWLIRIDRLRGFGHLSRDTKILFTYEGPEAATSYQEKALSRVLKEIQSQKVEVLEHRDTNGIRQFSES